MRLTAAIQGDLERYMRQEAADATAGVLAGIEEATDLLQELQRAQIRRAGLGTGLEKGWRKKFYKNQGLDAAGVVYHKTSKIIRAFDRGVTIRARRTRYLAIPTEEAVRLARRRVGRFGKLSPANWPSNLPPLRYVPRRGGPDLLVLDEMRVSASGRITKARRTKTGRMGKGAATVVAFVLVRQVKLEKKLDIDRASEQVASQLPQMIQRHYRTGPAHG